MDYIARYLANAYFDMSDARACCATEADHYWRLGVICAFINS